LGSRFLSDVGRLSSEIEISVTETLDIGSCSIKLRSSPDRPQVSPALRHEQPTLSDPDGINLIDEFELYQNSAQIVIAN